jgi:hypothetical protein
VTAYRMPSPTPRTDRDPLTGAGTFVYIATTPAAFTGEREVLAVSRRNFYLGTAARGLVHMPERVTDADTAAHPELPTT